MKSGLTFVNGDFKLSLVTIKGLEDIVIKILLVKSEVYPELQSVQYGDALLVAASIGSKVIVKLLLKNRADPYI